MPNMIRRVKRIGLRVALLWGILAILPSTTAWAHGHVIKVRPPNGVDDTANVQAALDAGVASGPGTTIQLAAGRYLTRQLLTFNFHGTFKGAGQSRTTVEALPNLVVDCPDICDGFRLAAADAKTYGWPSFIMFVDGDINVSDLSIRIPGTAGTSTQPYSMCGSPCTSWLNGLEFTGQHPMNVNVDRIALEGMPDDAPTAYCGFNVFNGVTFGGDFLKDTPDIQYAPLSGNFAVRNCVFKSVAAGVCNYFFFKDARVTYGGSPSAGNVFENVGNGMDLETAENSHFEVSYNRSSAIYTGMSVAQYYGDIFIPAKPSQFLIHDNCFTVSGTNPDPFFLSNRGIYLMNDPEHHWIQATIYNNTIEAQGLVKEGIGADNTKRMVLFNNTITGGGNDAIGLWGATFCTILGNHLGGFFADPAAGLAKIYLDPATSRNLIFCADPLDTVLDQGTNNRVIGGWPHAKAAPESLSLRSAHSTSLTRLHPLRRKAMPQK